MATGSTVFSSQASMMTIGAQRTRFDAGAVRAVESVVARQPLQRGAGQSAAASIAVDHLVALGHTRIAHLAGRPGGFNAGERLAGYRDGLVKHRLVFYPALVAIAGSAAEGGADAMRSLLASRPTAVLGATLVTAACAMAALHDAGLQILHDMSVIGLHDAPVATMLYPQLTSVRIPTETTGEMAAGTHPAVTKENLF